MPRDRRLLRTQLLAWLLAPLFLLLTADTFFGYWVAVNFSQRAYDRALGEIAREVSLHLRRDGDRLDFSMPAEARRVLFSDPEDRIYFEVDAADGRLIAGERIPPPRRDLSRQRHAEWFYDDAINGEPVRVVEFSMGADAAPDRPAATIRVAETGVKRNALAREILLSVIVPQALLIIIACVVVWVGVVHGLAPLKRLQRAVAMRSHLDRSPVVVDDVPGEVRPLVQSINGLLARLDSVLTLQSRFIADAAHQLKTPIAALKAQFDLAAREDDPERLRQSLRGMYPGLERLSRLVSQLLSLARNEPEAVGRLVLAPVDLNALALDVASAWVPEALRKGVDLGFDGAGGAVPVMGDPERLRELFDNLLDNAVRYSRDGGQVTVRVTATPAPVVAVNDDGPAIPPEERERVFERFHRLLGSSREGSGLGLSIAREIADLHGAEITLADDADGIGNSFRVVFPALNPA